MTEDTITAQPQPGQPQEMLPSAHTHYRKKPIPIVAYQLPVPPADGSTNEAHEEEVWAFLEWCSKVGFEDFTSERDGAIAITTLEGTMTANPGDWVIKGVKGEFYPCKADIFAETYEPCRATAPEAFLEIWGNGLGLDFSFKYGGDMTRHANFLGWWLHRNMALLGGLSASEFNAVQQARSEGFVDAVNQIQEQQAAAGEQQDQQDQQPASGPAMH